MNKFNPNDIIGQKFGKLTVLSLDRREGYYYYYNCQCDCGNVLSVLRGNLIYGRTKSCGCSRKGRKRAPAYKEVVYCSFCGQPEVYAKGLCRKCYMRQLLRGTPEYYVKKKTLSKEEKHQLKMENYRKKYSFASEQAKEIYKLLDSGVQIKDIAREYNVSRQQIYNIIK